MGLVPLQEETRKPAHSPATWRYNERSATGDLKPEPNHAGTVVSDFQPPELETYVSVVYKPPSICYNNPNKDASEIYFKKENFSSK